jgi:hypothetical protein
MEDMAQQPVTAHPLEREVIRLVPVPLKLRPRRSDHQGTALIIQTTTLRRLRRDRGKEDPCLKCLPAGSETQHRQQLCRAFDAAVKEIDQARKGSVTAQKKAPPKSGLSSHHDDAGAPDYHFWALYQSSISFFVWSFA